jgi:LPXTG-motif cell wall-anchored protein
MKTLGTVLLFFSCFVSILAQSSDQEIDSLLQLAANYHTQNQDSTNYYASLARQKAILTGDTAKIGRVNYLYAHYLVSHNDFDQATDVLQYNFDNRFKLSPGLLGESFYTLANIFYLKEEWDSAIKYYLESLELHEIGQNSKGLARSNLQLSLIYKKKGDSVLSNHFGDASLYHTGNPEYHKKFATASTVEEKFRQLEVAIKEQETNQNYSLQSQFHYTLGTFYLEAKNYGKSIENFEKAVQIKKETGYHNLKDKTTVYLAEANYGAGNFDKALEILNGLSANDKRQQPLKIENLLTETHQSLGNYEQALTHNTRLAFLQDSINQLEENIRIAEITAQYNTQEKEKQILSLQEANLEAESLISTQQKRWLALAGISLLLLLSTFWFVRRSKKSKQLALTTLKEKEAIVQTVQAQHLLLKSKAKVYLDDLYFVKADGNYVEFHSVEKKTLERDKLKEILEKLPPNFIRVHRSYLVNKNQIASYNSSTVILKSGQEIPLSRTYRSNLK